MNYRIAKEIFERFPGYVRGVVVAHDVANCASPEPLLAAMREAEASLRARVSLERIAEEPRIRAWREAYRAFGAKPSEFRSSIEALARRVLRGEPLPAINALVDIGNLVSLQHLVPAGAHAVDVLKEGLALRLASGTEEFAPFGSDALERPLPGEIVLADGETVVTRRWTWRQAKHTLTELPTRAVEFNVDGLPPVPAAEIEQACEELSALVRRYCGGRVRCELLTESRPQISLAD